MKSPITTHVLDLASGSPAVGIHARLDLSRDAGWEIVGNGTTDSDGRIRTLWQAKLGFVAGVYRLTFETGAYHESLGRKTFHPRITIEFVVGDVDRHYHVPLLLSPYGYSTYRGS